MQFDLSKLLGAYQSVPDGVDAHRWAAAQGFDVELAEVTPAMRADAKRLSFTQREGSVALTYQGQSVVEGGRSGLPFHPDSFEATHVREMVEAEKVNATLIEDVLASLQSAKTSD